MIINPNDRPEFLKTLLLVISKPTHQMVLTEAGIIDSQGALQPQLRIEGQDDRTTIKKYESLVTALVAQRTGLIEMTGAMAVLEADLGLMVKAPGDANRTVAGQAIIESIEGAIDSLNKELKK